MKPAMQLRTLCLLMFLTGFAAGTGFAAETGTLRAGAAKADITPSNLAGVTNLWGNPLTGVHDRTYARAIVLDNGITSAAIIAVDTVEITDGAPFVERISKETGIPAANVILAASHNHSAPMVSLVNIEGQRKAGPAGAAFIAQVSGALVAVVKQAQSNLRPARVGVGSGAVDININRDERTASGYHFGRNPTGPSDKTVWVIKFETLSGEPIALFTNYAVHATVIGPENSLLTGELPGASSRFIERHYQDKVVALWTSGAAGDQHPIVTTDGKDTENDFKVVDVLGQILGEEVVRVADGIKTMNSNPRIWGMEKFAACPGKIALTGPHTAAQEENPTATAPVKFRLGVLMIGHIALTAVSAEVVTKIYEEVRQQSPYTNTIMVTLANGRAGYVPDDASYDLRTEEALGSTFQKGCGESAITNGLLDLLRQY